MELKRVIDSFGTDNWTRLRKNKVTIRKMGGLIVEEPPCVLSHQIYKLIDESETITLKGNANEILYQKLEKYLLDFKRSIYAHIGIDQPKERLECLSSHINTTLEYQFPPTDAGDKFVCRIIVKTADGSSVRFQCDPKPTREGSVDVTAKIALEKLDAPFIWDSIRHESLLKKLNILFPHGLPIKFAVEEIQELSYEVKIWYQNQIICSKVNSFGAQAALESTELGIEILKANNGTSARPTEYQSSNFHCPPRLNSNNHVAPYCQPPQKPYKPKPSRSRRERPTSFKNPLPPNFQHQHDLSRMNSSPQPKREVQPVLPRVPNLPPLPSTSGHTKLLSPDSFAKLFESMPIENERAKAAIAIGPSKSPPVQPPTDSISALLAIVGDKEPEKFNASERTVAASIAPTVIVAQPAIGQSNVRSMPSSTPVPREPKELPAQFHSPPHQPQPPLSMVRSDGAKDAALVQMQLYLSRSFGETAEEEQIMPFVPAKYNDED